MNSTSRISTQSLSGLLLPITTPFQSDETIDRQGLTANIEKWNDAGIAGYVVLGSTGERVNLDEREYLQVIETARTATPETMAFIVGAGQQSTRGTIVEIERAAAAGADAVLVITPNFYRSAITQSALIDYYSAVADAAKIQVLLYSMPDLTGIVIEPETAARLCQHENIVGMKDSSNDIERFRRTVQLVDEDFAMMIGNGTVFADALRAGARGGILAVGCCASAICLDIFRAFQADDDVHATELQDRLTPLARAVTKTYGIGGLKSAMEMAGYVGGPVRAPLRRPNEAAVEEIASLLSKCAVSSPGAAASGSSAA
jgi:dihydrodipicolinate synthase/N-acetylneuraminate lyase